MKPNACDPEQSCGQSMVDVLHTAGLTQNCSPGSNVAATSSSAAWMSMENKSGIKGSPCSPPLSLGHCASLTLCIPPTVIGWVACESRTNGRMTLWHLLQTLQHCRSEDVVVRPNAVHAQNYDCVTQHVPHTISPSCCGQRILEWCAVLATNLLKEQPVAIPRTPPSGLAIIAHVRASATSCGTVACAKLETASKSNPECQPCRAHANARSAPFRLLMKMFRLTCRSTSGWCSNTFLGMLNLLRTP